MKLRDGLFGRTVQGTPVLLDVHTGRYSSLRGAMAHSFIAFEKHAASGHDLDVLGAAGLLEPIEAYRPRIAPPIDPTSADDGTVGTIAPRLLVCEAAIAQCISRRRVCRMNFHALVMRRKRAPRKIVRRQATQAGIAAAFAKTKAILPSVGQCLPRSLAIATMLERYGHRPRIVLGVHLPFSAHCWVQCDDHVVGDCLDVVRSFVPLAAL